MDVQPFPIGKKLAKWFDKATLLDVIRFTNEQHLGEPPSETVIQAFPDTERFPVVWEVLHESTPDFDRFYRCGLRINDGWFRVAVTPSLWERLPVDEFVMPLM